MMNKVNFSYFKKISLLKILFLLFFNATALASVAIEHDKKQSSIFNFMRPRAKKLLGLAGLTGFGSLFYLLLSKKSPEGGNFEQIDEVLSDQGPLNDLMKILGEDVDFQRSNQNNIVIINENGQEIDQSSSEDQHDRSLKTNNRDQDIINSILKKEDFQSTMSDRSNFNRFIEILNQSDNKLIPYYYCDDESLLYSNNNTPQTCIYITKEILQKLFNSGVLDNRSYFFSNISFAKANHPEEALNIVLKMILKRKKRIEIVNRFMDSNKFDLIQGKINVFDNSNVFKYQIIERLCNLFFYDEELIQEVDIFYDLFNLFDEHCKGETIKDQLDKFEDCAGNILLPFLRYLIETHDDIMKIGSLKQKSNSLIVEIEMIKYLSEGIKQSYLEFVCHALSEAIRDNDDDGIAKNKHCFEFFLTHHKLTCDFKKCNFDILLADLIHCPEELNLFLKHIETKIMEADNVDLKILLDVLTTPYLKSFQVDSQPLCGIQWSNEKKDYVLLLPSAYISTEKKYEYEFLEHYFEKYLKNILIAGKINQDAITKIENPDEIEWLFEYVEKNYPHKLIDLFFIEKIGGEKILIFKYPTKIDNKEVIERAKLYEKLYFEIFNAPDKKSKEYLDTIASHISLPLFLKLSPEELTSFLKNCCVTGEALLNRENNIISTLLNFTSVDQDAIIFMQDFFKKMIDDNIAEIAFLVSQCENFSFDPLLSGKEGSDRLALCNTLNQLKNLDKNDKNAEIEKQIFDYRTIFLIQYDNFMQWFDPMVTDYNYNTDEEITSYKKIVLHIMARYAKLGGNKEKLLKHIKIFYDGEHIYATLQEKNNKNILKALCFLSDVSYFSDTENLFDCYKEVIQQVHFKDFLVVKSAILQSPTNDEFKLFLEGNEKRRLEIILSDLEQCSTSNVLLTSSKNVDIKTALMTYDIELIEGDNNYAGENTLHLSKDLIARLANVANDKSLFEIQIFFRTIVENFIDNLSPFGKNVQCIDRPLLKQNLIELLVIGVSSHWKDNDSYRLLIKNLIYEIVNHNKIKLEITDLKRLSENMLNKSFYIFFLKLLNSYCDMTTRWTKEDRFKALGDNLMEYVEIIIDYMWFIFEKSDSECKTFLNNLSIHLRNPVFNNAFIRYKNQNYNEDKIDQLYEIIFDIYGDFNINELSVDFTNYIINTPKLLKFVFEQAEKNYGDANDLMDFVDNKVLPLLAEKKLSNDSEYDFLKPYSLVKDCCKILTDYREKQRENGNQVFHFEDPEFPVEYLSKNLSLQLLLAMERREIQAVCQYQTKQIHKKLSERSIWSFFQADGRKSNNEQLKTIFAQLFDDCSLEFYLNFAFGQRKYKKLNKYQESFTDIQGNRIKKV